MVLVIFITNVLTRKINEMKKMIQIENKHINSKEPKGKSLTKVYAPKKMAPHQTKMKSVKVRQKEFYLWKYKTLIKKKPKRNMKRKRLTT
jgi:hypothetical protein